MEGSETVWQGHPMAREVDRPAEGLRKIHGGNHRSRRRAFRMGGKCRVEQSREQPCGAVESAGVRFCFT